MEIGLLGTGLLGAAIGERLLACGHRLTVWNRRPARCSTLLALGATSAPTAAMAAAAGELVITVLSDGAATRAVLMEQAASALQGRLVLQVATIAPSESEGLANDLEAQVAGPAHWPVDVAQVQAGGVSLSPLQPEIFWRGDWASLPTLQP